MHKIETLVMAADSAITSDYIRFQEYNKGMIHMPSAWTTADIAFAVCHESNGTYLPLHDSSGLVTIAVAASQSYNLPDALKGCGYFKIKSVDTGDASDEAQAAQRLIKVECKS